MTLTTRCDVAGRSLSSVARATASVEDLKEGNLPPVCAKTGEAADGFATIEFTSTPGWTWILLLFGIFPFLIAHYYATIRVMGLVPMSDAALRRGRSFTWTYRGFLLLGGLVLLLGVFTGPTVAMIGAGTLIAAILFTLVGWLFVWPTGQVSGEWVVMSFVDERFATALDRWYNP